LTFKVLERTKQRAEGKQRHEVDLDPELRLTENESLLNYGDQSKTYYFDYNTLIDGNEFGLEAGISTQLFTIACYSDKTFPVLQVDIKDINSNLTESEFFQLSTICDFGELTFEQMRHIIMIRDAVRATEVKWGVHK